MPEFGWIPPTDEERAMNERYHTGLYGWVAPDVVERIIDVPDQRKFYDQKNTPKCVAFSAQITQTDNAYNNHTPAHTVTLYDAPWLFKQAGGTSNGAMIYRAMDVLKKQGDVIAGQSAPQKDQGIASYAWARSIDDIRAAINEGRPVVFGTDWLSGMSDPSKRNGEWWLNVSGQVMGGHAYNVYGASDQRQAFCMMNSWGATWPTPTWITYSAANTLIFQRGGECCIPTDIQVVPPPPPPPPPTNVVTAAIEVTVNGIVYKSGAVKLT